MDFNYDDLHDSVLYGESNKELDLIVIDQSSWEQDGKYQNQETIFKHNDKYYTISQTRSGSPFSEWHYEDIEIDEDGNVYCEEVFLMEHIKQYWSANDGITEVDRLRTQLETATNLLNEAHDIMDDVHLYESKVYKAIGEFLNGNEE
jgi:hypothetical protein